MKVAANHVAIAVAEPRLLVVTIQSSAAVFVVVVAHSPLLMHKEEYIQWWAIFGTHMMKIQALHLPVVMCLDATTRVPLFEDFISGGFGGGQGDFALLYEHMQKAHQKLTRASKKRSKS